MQPSNRVKLNRNAFRLENVSVDQKRRRKSVRDPVSGTQTEVTGTSPVDAGRSVDANQRRTCVVESAGLRARSRAQPLSSARCRTRSSNFNKKAVLRRCLGLVTRFGSGRHVKRSVKNSCCALCGDVKYTPPPASKKLPQCISKPRLRCPGLIQRQVRITIPPAAQAQPKTKILLWLQKYPKVKLCDVARVFDVPSRDFSCVLPAEMHGKRKHRAVRCFKRQFMSLMRHNSPDNDKWISSKQIWKVCAPTNRCASLSSGERISEDSAGECVSSHEGSRNKVTRTLDQRMSLRSDKESHPCNPSSCGESQPCDEAAQKKVGRTELIIESGDDSANQRLRVPPLVLRRVVACGVDSPQHFQSKLSVDRNTENEVGESDLPQDHLEENGVSEESEGEEYPPDLFSCQRVQPYEAWPRFSCARTYTSWPFPRHGPSPEFKTSVSSGPRWILTSSASDTIHEINTEKSCLSKSSECTTENNTKDCPDGVLGSSDRNDAQNVEDLISAKLCWIQPNLSEVKETIQDPCKAFELDLVKFSKPSGPKLSLERESTHLSQPERPCLDSGDDSCPALTDQQNNVLGLMSTNLQDKNTKDCPDGLLGSSDRNDAQNVQDQISAKLSWVQPNLSEVKETIQDPSKAFESDLVNFSKPSGPKLSLERESTQLSQPERPCLVSGDDSCPALIGEQNPLIALQSTNLQDKNTKECPDGSSDRNDAQNVQDQISAKLSRVQPNLSEVEQNNVLGLMSTNLQDKNTKDCPDGLLGSSDRNDAQNVQDQTSAKLNRVQLNVSEVKETIQDPCKASESDLVKSLERESTQLSQPERPCLVSGDNSCPALIGEHGHLLGFLSTNLQDKNTKNCPGGVLGLSDMNDAQNVEDQMSAKLIRVQPNLSEVKETIQDPSKAFESNLVKFSKQSGPKLSAERESTQVSQPDTPFLESGENHSPETGEHSCPALTDQQNNVLCLMSTNLQDSPVEMYSELSELVGVTGNNKHERISSSDKTQRSALDKTVERKESDAGASKAMDHFQKLNHKQTTLQTTPIEVNSREESHNSCMMVRSSLKPESSSAVRVHHEKEQSFNAPDEKRIVIPDPVPSQTSKIRERKWKIHLKSLKSKAESFSSSSSSEDDYNANHSSCDEEAESDLPLLQDEMYKINKVNHDRYTPHSSTDNLDVLRAYEEDAIVLDVIQDDPELFGAVGTDSAEHQTRKCGLETQKQEKKVFLQTKKTNTLKNHHKIVWDLNTDSPRKPAAGVNEENLYHFNRVKTIAVAQGSKSQLVHNRSWTPIIFTKKSEEVINDCNNNLEENIDVNFNNVVIDTCSSVWDPADTGTSVPRSSSVPYCRFYFSEQSSCFRPVCWYNHVPRAEDEKLCMETVQKFCHAGNPVIVQRAVEVFVGYYRANSPGVSFSQNIVNSLLSTLLNLEMLRDLLSVINTLLIHKVTPPTEFVMALYEHVSKRGLISFVPEIILLTSKIIEAGCVFTGKDCEMMQTHLQTLQVSRQQMDVFNAIKCRSLVTNPHTAEVSVLSQAMIQVEMCKQQQNWLGLASVFCSVCAGHYSAGEVSRFCCCVTTALLSEAKDKLTLPFEPFAESVCQEVPYDGLVKSFLGRVGVSLMFIYHRFQDWSKGMKLVQVMSQLNLEFSTLKGCFDSEEGASRCQIITTAAELFLNSGSIEGALNVLRADEWFVSSSVWSCEQTDVENRRRVLTLLAGRTSHRDTLEVLSNLPGLSQPVGGVQVGEYCSVFNAHLQKCVTNNVLSVAADTLDFMLTQRITVESLQLHSLIHRLGKQNAWNRARALFKRAHSAGYYSELQFEGESLAVSCNLSEIEMTLAFEMFIAFQKPTDSSHPLLIILKRDSGGKAVVESKYLAAGCSLLSAALIPNPKLNIRYVAVNHDQEQYFHLDSNSAAKWLSQNHSWAQEMLAS